MFKITYDLDTLRARKREQINGWKEDAEKRGLYYEFDGEGDYIQLRHDRDRTNITALVTQATLLKMQGETGKVVAFMPESNTLRMMTPDEVIQMGLAVGQFGSQCYATAWALKAAVEDATTAEQINNIQWPLT